MVHRSAIFPFGSIPNSFESGPLARSTGQMDRLCARGFNTMLYNRV